MIIPAHNEERTITEVINKVNGVDLEKLGIKKEIIVVDDGSTDSTAKVVRDNFPFVVLLKNEVKEGKGSAVKKAIGYSNSDFYVIQDADLEYDPKEYPRLLAPLAEGKAEIVYGSRFLGRGYPSEMIFANYVGNLLGTFIANALYGGALTDLMTGYKVFSRSALEGITITRKGFDICPELTAKLLRKGKKIYEVPIDYHGRGKRQGKKIKLIDSLFILGTLCRFRFWD